MILSCKIKAIPIIENTEFGGGLTGCRVGLWKKGELAFITTIKQKKCQGVAVNVNCLFIKKNHYERSVKCVLTHEKPF